MSLYLFIWYTLRRGPDDPVGGNCLTVYTVYHALNTLNTSLHNLYTHWHLKVEGL